MPSVRRNHHLKTSPYVNLIQIICTFNKNRKKSLRKEDFEKNKKKNTIALLKLRATKWYNDHIDPQVVKEPKLDQNYLNKIHEDI